MTGSNAQIQAQKAADQVSSDLRRGVRFLDQEGNELTEAVEIITALPPDSRYLAAQ